MRASSKLAQWVEQTTQMTCFYVQVPEDIKYPECPYLIIAESTEFLNEQTLDRRIDAETVYLYISVVDSTPGNVINTRDKVRKLLNPNQYGQTLDLEPGIRMFIKRNPDMCQPVMVDTENSLDQSGRRASFAVDVYNIEQINFTPLEG